MVCDFVIAAESARWGMPEIDLGITPGWGGTTCLTRLIGRRRSKELNLLGALMSAHRAVELDLWNSVVPDGQLDAQVDALLKVLRSKNQQAVRQMKFIIDRGIEADLHTAQGFETLSGALIASLYIDEPIPDCDPLRPGSKRSPTRAGCGNSSARSHATSGRRSTPRATRVWRVSQPTTRTRGGSEQAENAAWPRREDAAQVSR